MFLSAPDPVVACGIVLALVCLAFLEVGQWRFKTYSKVCPTVFDFAMANFPALSNHRGFITIDTLFDSFERFPEHSAELRFLVTYLSEFGHVIDSYESMTVSDLGPGVPFEGLIWGATRKEIASASATVSPILGLIHITRK